MALGHDKIILYKGPTRGLISPLSCPSTHESSARRNPDVPAAGCCVVHAARGDQRKAPWWAVHADHTGSQLPPGWGEGGGR